MKIMETRDQKSPKTVILWNSTQVNKNYLQKVDIIILSAKINNKNVPNVPIVIEEKEFKLVQPNTMIINIAIDEGENLHLFKTITNT